MGWSCVIHCRDRSGDTSWEGDGRCVARNNACRNGRNGHCRSALSLVDGGSSTALRSPISPRAVLSGRGLCIAPWLISTTGWPLAPALSATPCLIPLPPACPRRSNRKRGIDSDEEKLTFRHCVHVRKIGRKGKVEL